ncbi:MAG TPA: triphosphoribosyl-dephospho-CoA synthase [Solirubrobacteraceae bacterium]|nr:triphosphoribosyl-dephospho-CoA synthase [Solirubrobacteraceae bacterium]
MVTLVDATLAHSRLSRDLLAQHVQLACLLEVSAAKPGNITPTHDFSDTTYADMVRSALALGPVFGRRRARRRGVGELISDGVSATGRVTRANTNLGIVLLFAPLVRAEATRESDESLRSATERILGQLDIGDAAAAFGAIVRARPGGLGEASEHDVGSPARISLRDAMAAAAHRDSIASEYASGYAIVFDAGLPSLAQALDDGVPTLDAIVSLHVALLASHPDTLIERKAGASAARAVSAAAREVRAGTRTLDEFDASLRGADHRLNPGTTADLVAGTLLAALLTGVTLP